MSSDATLRRRCCESLDCILTIKIVIIEKVILAIIRVKAIVIAMIMRVVRIVLKIMIVILAISVYSRIRTTKQYLAAHASRRSEPCVRNTRGVCPKGSKYPIIRYLGFG